MKFFRALVQACGLTALVLGVFAAISAHDAFSALGGMLVAGLFAIALAVIEADAAADRRSEELKDTVLKWMENQRQAERASEDRARAMPRAMADGPPLLPKRTPVVPGRRFPVQTLDGFVRVEVAA
jgi:hypothetical protein